jgi:hypothetical protein
MTMKYSNIFHSIKFKFKIYPNWDIWFENIPSGNPGGQKNSKTQKRVCTLMDMKIYNRHRCKKTAQQMV